MVLIRADADRATGVGHVMRCLTIAESIKKKGEEVLFISNAGIGADIITGKGFTCDVVIPKWETPSAEVKYIMEKMITGADILLVDSYNVCKEYFTRLKGYVKTAYIDDENNNIWDVNYLINYNIFAKGYDYSGYDGLDTMLLLGTEYAPLRNEFQIREDRIVKKEVRDVLVSAGGTDPAGVCRMIMKELCPLRNNMRFHFLIGQGNPIACENKDINAENVFLHLGEKSVSSLMKSCDVAISAAGSTLYELCACSIPTITYSMANNQIIATRTFEEKGLMLNVGDCRDNDRFIVKLNESLDILSNDLELRKQMSISMGELVDGKGAMRIVEVLISNGE